MLRLHLFVLFFMIVGLLQAQDTTRTEKIYLGLDIEKPLIGIMTRSIVVEPLVKVALTQNLYVNAVVGYSHIRQRGVYQNLSYHNKGYYGKVGMEFFIFHPRRWESGITFSFGLNAVYSQFDEWGTARLKGPYFGDLTQSFSQPGLKAFGVEQTFNLGVSTLPSERLYVNFQLRFNESVNQPVGRVFPIYHIPGMGNIFHGGESMATDKGANLTGGVTIQVFYKLF